ncbi:MAG: hypothetical protein HOQ18_02490 [Dermatophilaceae bacterium]|nr:hypothetical protein [Dermatophilaceae bacterium]NUR79072.1 hypothetical protein [Dermatophilaceae bacterium]
MGLRGEGLLDPATDEQVRREWGLLAMAGPPSQASHRGESNAPHLTVRCWDPTAGRTWRADGIPTMGA